VVNDNGLCEEGAKLGTMVVVFVVFVALLLLGGIVVVVLEGGVVVVVVVFEVGGKEGVMVGDFDGMLLGYDVTRIHSA
jgi:hypothetical protein